MKLGIFPWFSGGTVGGCEIYEFSLIRALARLDHGNDYRIFCLNERALQAFDVPNDRFLRERVGRGSRWLSIPVSLPWRLLRQPVDLLHVTTVPPPLTRQRYVFTMHCVSSFERPEFYPAPIRLRLNALLRCGLRDAVHILCVSEHVRQCTAERFGIPLERMTVVHHGVDPAFRPRPRSEARAQVAERFGLHAPYLLAVGWVEARKNTARILSAFSRFVREVEPEARLVFAGARHWQNGAMDRLIAELGLGSRVVHLGSLDHAELPAVYAAARMLVFPSLWEGFGLPILEAMACGTPVICSNTSCMPEVAGAAALLVDPLSAEDIASAMARIWRNDALGDELRGRGIERAAEFTWERSARATRSIYERFARS